MGKYQNHNKLARLMYIKKILALLALVMGWQKMKHK
jgi:hypothetical protein